jgi:hypothetical protein
VLAAWTCRGCRNRACQSVNGEGRAECGSRICDGVHLLSAKRDTINLELPFEEYLQPQQAINAQAEVRLTSKTLFFLMIYSSFCNFAETSSPPFSRFDCIGVSALLSCPKTPPSDDSQRPVPSGHAYSGNTLLGRKSTYGVKS